jgi:glycine/D-amino acid oxidase-like deaminating enzyme/nitrite reductase/ring-hydroxylating ferredoxin subunit
MTAGNKGTRDSTSGAKVSIWTRSAETPMYPVAPAGLHPEVCVVGAGIAGLTVAYALAGEGVSVVIVDDGAIGSGETGRTSAHLSNAVDDRYQYIEAMHGGNAARLVAESHTAAIDRIEAIVAAEKIDCGFERVPGYLFPAPDEDPAFLERETAASQRAGLRTQTAPRVPILRFDTGPALMFPDQAQFHPLRYLSRLAEAVVRRGGRIFTAHASDIEGGAKPQVALKSGHVIRCNSVVVATNVPVNDRISMHTKLEPFRSYVIAAPIPAGRAPKALLWDSGSPYHYVRTVNGAGSPEGMELLLVGGEDHRVGQAADFDARYGALEMWMRSRFPEAGPVHSRWSGQIIETVDGLAYIGRNPGEKNVYIATGDSGNGLTHGTIAGMLIPDLIMGRNNPWTGTYDPGRVTLKAAGEFARHNLNAALKYADWFKGHETLDEKQIPPGDGAVVRHGLKHVAAYRDEEGNLHRLSAVCPHLQCIVTWNGSEKSWDCPCHGSRFNCRGHVLNGPAIGDMEHLEPEKAEGREAPDPVKEQ